MQATPGRPVALLGSELLGTRVEPVERETLGAQVLLAEEEAPETQAGRGTPGTQAGAETLVSSAEQGAREGRAQLLMRERGAPWTPEKALMTNALE